VCKEKRKILFCIRDVTNASDRADLRAKVTETFNQALRRTNSECHHDDIDRVFEIDIAFISMYDAFD
jgi:hypothetical protein